MGIATFNNPTRLSIDSNNILYVADSGNYGFRKVTSTNVYTLVGNGQTGTTDGGQDEAWFSVTMGIVRVADGVWAVVDSASLRIITWSKSSIYGVLDGS